MRVGVFTKAQDTVKDAAATVKGAAEQTGVFVRLAIGIGIVALVVAVIAIILGVRTARR